MSETPSPQLCQVVGDFAHFLPWKILIAVKMVIALLAMIASYFLVKDVGCRWLVHPNAKILFANHIFWSTLSPFLYFLLYVIDMIRLSQEHENPCDFLLSTKFALFFRTLHVNAAMAQNFSVFVLAIERVFSVCFLQRYEKITNPFLGILLLSFAVISCLLLPYCIYVFPFLNTKMLDSFTPTISHRNQFNMDAAPMVSYIQLVTEFTALLLFHATLVYSRFVLKARLKTRIHSVSKTYQAQETEKVVRPLLFVFWTHFVICILQAGATGSFKVWFGENAPLTVFAFWLEIFTQFPLYTILLTLLLHSKSYLRRKKTSVTNDIQQQDEYFNDLRQMFESRLSEKNLRKEDGNKY